MLAESARIYELSGVDVFAGSSRLSGCCPLMRWRQRWVAGAREDNGGITGAVVPVDGGLSL